MPKMHVFNHIQTRVGANPDEFLCGFLCNQKTIMKIHDQLCQQRNDLFEIVILLQKFGIMRGDYEMLVKIVRVTSLDPFQQLWRVGI